MTWLSMQSCLRDSERTLVYLYVPFIFLRCVAAAQIPSVYGLLELALPWVGFMHRMCAYVCAFEFKTLRVRSFW